MNDVTLEDHLQNDAAPTDVDETADTNAQSKESRKSNNLANFDDQSTNKLFYSFQAGANS